MWKPVNGSSSVKVRLEQVANEEEAKYTSSHAVILSTSFKLQFVATTRARGVR